MRVRIPLAKRALHIWVACLLVLPLTANAFGLKTHIWIGQKLLSEISSSCRVTINNDSFPIDPDVCTSVRAHPGAFLSGVLGPDAFPDLISGQVTTHPGIPNGWQTSDWLVHMYSEAGPGPDLAFAAGYLVHGASDIFAHTYVNAFAGDVFVLTDERRVELRHFLLEKYIDSRLPNYAFSPEMLNPPAKYLRDKLIHHPEAARAAKGSGVALHIAVMHDIHREVSHLAGELDRVEEDAAKLLAGLIAEAAEANIKLATGEVQLKLAREALSANELRLQAEQELFDAANKAFQDASDLLQENRDLVNTLGLQAKAARLAAEEAQKVANEATNRTAELQKSILDLENRLANIPPTVARQVCRDVVRNYCDFACPLVCKKICKDVTEQVCSVVNVANDLWINVNNEISGAKSKLNDEQKRAAQAAIDITAHLATETLKLQEKASAEALTAGLEAAKAAAQVTYEVHKTQLDLERNATREARNDMDTIAAEIERLRKRMVDLAAVKEALVDLIARSDVLSGFAKNWVHGMDVAGEEFIVASNKVARGMLEGRSDFATTYLHWWKCTGQAYTGVPVQFGQVICASEDFMTKIDEETSKIVERTLPPPFNKVYADLLNIRNLVKKELKKKVNDAAIDFAKLVSPDPTTGHFIELLARPEGASQSEMNNAFASKADTTKPLLTFSQVSDLIDDDMKLRNGRLDPEEFAALKNALTLSKLSLMQISGVKQLAWVLGADADRIKAPVAPLRTSLLFDMVRSIDGNHQWQPYGLPYASATGSTARPANSADRRYGYGPGQERPGFQLFVDDQLRRTIFLRVFDGPISLSLQSHLVGYPFPECIRNPFAVSFNPDGTSSDRDDGCMQPTKTLVQASPWEWWRQFMNRLRLNPY